MVRAPMMGHPSVRVKARNAMLSLSEISNQRSYCLASVDELGRLVNLAGDTVRFHLLSDTLCN